MKAHIDEYILSEKMYDLISRQSAIQIADAIWMETGDKNVAKIWQQLQELPPAQSERLTDDDFETIRIHLNVYKEKLCNQHRWKEAEEYQRIIERFMSFASVQTNVIRCKDCEHYYNDSRCEMHEYLHFKENDFCSYAERKKEN